MAIKHSPGCGCCASQVAVTGCCVDTDLKDMPLLSYDPLANSYSFSETQWYYTDSNGDRQTYFSGNVPADGSATPNVLPAGSTVTAEFNICCLDYIFDIEVLTWDSADENSYIKVGATQFKSVDSGSSTSIKAHIQSRTGYNVLESSGSSANFTQGYQQGYAVFEMGSFLGNGSTEERVVAFNYHPRRGSVNYFTQEQTTYSDGKGDPSWAVNLSRPVKLTIHAGDSDIEIGAIRLRQGANTASTGSSSCINYSGTGLRRPHVNLAKYEWPLVRKGVSIYKAGYGTTVLESDAVGRTNCNVFLPPALYAARKQPKHTYTNTFDHSGKNGNWSYDLVRLNAGVTHPSNGYTSATLADQNSIDDLATACRTDDWEAISLIPDWWNLWYVEPQVCPPAVPDNTNCSSGAGSPYTVDSSCTSSTTSPSFTSSNSWPWYFGFNSVNTAQPCPYADLFDFTDQTSGGFYKYKDTTELYQSIVSWGGYGNPSFAGSSLQSTINSYYTTNNPYVDSGCDVDGFTSTKQWSTDQLQFVPSEYSLTTAGIYNVPPDRYESSNATNNFKLADSFIPTVSHSSTAFSGTVYSADQATVAASGYIERQLGFTVAKTWVENVQGTNETLSVDDEVQGDWTGETLQYVEYEKATIPDTKQGRTVYAKVHQNCIHDFEVISTPYTGNPPVAGTPVTVSQTGKSVIPAIAYQGSSTTRPTGVYNDGKIYQLSDDGFNPETDYWSSVGFFLHEVNTDDGDTYHVLFGNYSVVVEIRRLSDNTKFSGTATSGTTSGCSGQGYSQTYGSTSVEGTVTEISFVVKGSR